jgi:hypothetical protein
MSGPKPVNTVAPVAAGVRVQTSAYGRVVPVVLGRNRIASNLVWANNFRAIPITSNQSGGGKGGGGRNTSTTWEYQIALLIGLCHGVATVVRAWEGKSAKSAADFGAVYYTGTDTQTTWSWLQSNYPAEALAYRHLAYAAFHTFALGDQTAIPNLTFEMQGPFALGVNSVNDCDPSVVVNEMLTNVRWGARFPAALVGSLGGFSDYAVAASLFVSPAWVEQASAGDRLKKLCEIANTDFYFSEGLLKFKPRADAEVIGNGRIFSPDNTAVYTITDDDLLPLDNGGPVRISRIASSDAPNAHSVSFADRALDYADNVAQWRDQAAIDLFGLREPRDAEKLDEVVDANVALRVATHKGQRAQNIRNEYQFRLPFRFELLEPTDLLLLNESGQGIANVAVRIREIEDDGEGEASGFLVTAEDYPAGVSSTVLYPTQAAGGYSQDYNAAPGNTMQAYYIEAPFELARSATGFELWVGVCGGANWGGCQVWVSESGADYRYLGDIFGPSRLGQLHASIAAGADPDTTNTLQVDLSLSGTQLTAGGNTEADRGNTLAWVDGELIAFGSATLVAPNRYNLTYLRRGLYRTPNAAHPVGRGFVRIDEGIFRYPYEASRVGRVVYVKLLSFNKFGNGVQGLADVSADVVTLTGAGAARNGDGANQFANHSLALPFGTGVTPFVVYGTDGLVGSGVATNFDRSVAGKRVADGGVTMSKQGDTAGASYWGAMATRDWSYPGGFFPVQAGRRYQWSAFVGTEGCDSEVRINFYDAAGTFLAPQVVGSRLTPAEGKPGGTKLDDYKELYAIVTAPTNAVWALPTVFSLTSQSAAVSSTHCCRALWTEVSADRVSPVPWTPAVSALLTTQQLAADSAQLYDINPFTSPVLMQTNGQQRVFDSLPAFTTMGRPVRMECTVGGVATPGNMGLLWDVTGNRMPSTGIANIVTAVDDGAHSAFERRVLVTFATPHGFSAGGGPTFYIWGNTNGYLSDWAYSNSQILAATTLTLTLRVDTGGLVFGASTGGTITTTFPTVIGYFRAAELMENTNPITVDRTVMFSDTPPAGTWRYFVLHLLNPRVSGTPATQSLNLQRREYVRYEIRR